MFFSEKEKKCDKIGLEQIIMVFTDMAVTKQHTIIIIFSNFVCINWGGVL